MHLYLLLIYFCLSRHEGVQCNRSNTYRSQQQSKSSRMPAISAKDIEDAFEEGKHKCEENEKLEQKLFKEGWTVQRNSRTPTAIFHNQKSTPPRNRRDAKLQEIFEAASGSLIKKYKLNSQQAYFGLPRLPLSSPKAAAARQTCVSESVQCDLNSKYRTINGLCNNPDNPTWGSIGSCFTRLLPADYTGVSGFRRSVTGGPLPEPRILSLNIHCNRNREKKCTNHLYMFFGQLLDHDIALTPVSTTVDNQLIECCPAESAAHPQCAPINLPDDDPFYAPNGMKCMNFIRSAVCRNCRLGTRIQSNSVTTFIDASFVYGNEQNVTDGLRTNDGTGMLRVQRTSVGDLPPPSNDPNNDQCSNTSKNEICFEIGDARGNQHPTLTSLHTIFIRHHNRLARRLRAVNPSWDDDRIFNESRRILGGIVQVITYKEYLPITLGNEGMTFFGLWLSDGYTSYNRSQDVRLYTEFSTAAFRFGHTLINTMVAEIPNEQGHSGHLFRNTYFYPFGLFENEVDLLLQGSIYSPSQSFDRYMVPDVTNYLIKVRGSNTGADLASINIQRGRDHGIATYVNTVRYCSKGNIQIKNFDDLLNYNLMNPDTVSAIQRSYRSVYDIDLYTGCISEIPRQWAVVGPTVTCILGRQFRRLKYGDRFYFEHGRQAGSFTKKQLKEIRKVTFANIICENTGIAKIPRNAMMFDSSSNPMVQCSRLPSMDFTAWQEYKNRKKTCHMCKAHMNIKT